MKKKILIVDDEQDAREILARRLQQQHFIVATAGSGKEAISECALDTPDLILLDIALSDTDGFSLVEELERQKLLKKTPVIFITGKDFDYAQIERRFEGLERVDYLQKPVLFEDILGKIREAFA